MGGTSWDDDHYTARVNDRAARGVGAFDHSDRALKDRATLKVHPEMDPKGVTMRESRDSEAHPNSKAIAIFFDVTASMQDVPMECQRQLPKLQETFLSRGYCEDPQTLFGAVTDCHNDGGGHYGNKVPLQVGQFESGIEMDEDLGKVILEGGGGGTFEESYELALYFLARHTSIDCWEKRQDKGYAFLIGDEKSYEEVSPETAEKIFGDKLEAPVALDTLIREVQERYNLYFIIPEHTAHGSDPVLKSYWEGKLGQNVLMLPDASHICDLIGSTVGLMEGKVDAATIRSNSKVTGSLDNVAAAGANERL